MAGDGLDRLEPGQQRLVTAMEDRTGGDGRLAAAAGALIREWLGIERPGFSSLAFRADEAIRPAFFKQVAGACLIVGKPLSKSGSRHGAVVFPAARHRNKIGTFRQAVKAAGLPMGGPDSKG